MIIEILQARKITDYLSSKGIEPIKRGHGGKIFYCCPFPDHQETKPSFTVYTNGEYENFYCYGCNRKYHIIHLISELENISFKDAIKMLGFDINVGFDIVINSDVKIIGKECSMHQNNINNELSKNLMEISRNGSIFVEQSGSSQDPQCIMNKVYAQIDSALLNADFDEIKKINGLLMNQINKYRRNKRIAQNNGINKTTNTQSHEKIN